MGELEGGPQRTFPALPESAAHAREFVRDRLAASVALDVVCTAELLVGELVTNAVLHTRTEVGVSARSVDGTVHARVVDGDPRRGLVPRRRHPYTDTGRGLYLVERLASITAQVGGDWCDGFALPDGGTAVVIGDVTGSDIDATATMSRLSSMLRGISVVCQEPPEEVLRHLDMANRPLVQEATGTCVYAGAHGSRASGWELSRRPHRTPRRAARPRPGQAPRARRRALPCPSRGVLRRVAHQAGF
ncbi:SpoIIE family protein phosphatase [Spirillospora sp. NPDC000708]